MKCFPSQKIKTKQGFLCSSLESNEQIQLIQRIEKCCLRIINDQPNIGMNVGERQEGTSLSHLISVNHEKSKRKQ